VRSREREGGRRRVFKIDMALYAVFTPALLRVVLCVACI
jgi:hypothetical protein